MELANAVGLTRDGIKYHINKLKRDGAIRRVGPARGGHWEILK
jgi:ATP-dependent DNA helicase RecG